MLSRNRRHFTPSRGAIIFQSIHCHWDYLLLFPACSTSSSWSMIYNERSDRSQSHQFPTWWRFWRYANPWVLNVECQTKTTRMASLPRQTDVRPYTSLTSTGDERSSLERGIVYRSVGAISGFLVDFWIWSQGSKVVFGGRTVHLTGLSNYGQLVGTELHTHSSHSQAS